jgi:hypothetical protein
MQKLGFETDQNSGKFSEITFAILAYVGFCHDFENAKMSRLKMIQILKTIGGVRPW